MYPKKKKTSLDHCMTVLLKIIFKVKIKSHLCFFFFGEYPIYAFKKNKN